MRREILTILALAPLLSACGGGKVESASATQPKRSPPSRVLKYRQPVKAPPPAPQVQHLTGLESVIGATTAQLTRQFGPARLDVWEGDARKLQFTGDACVLDVYLYPASQGREPQATYIDARRGSDGKDVDRPACIQALKKP
ncbi:MAG: hypothetical protein AB7F98_04610 [Novosphingobium sp.]